MFGVVPSCPSADLGLYTDYYREHKAAISLLFYCWCSFLPSSTLLLALNLSCLNPPHFHSVSLLDKSTLLRVRRRFFSPSISFLRTFLITSTENPARCAICWGWMCTTWWWPNAGVVASGWIVHNGGTVSWCPCRSQSLNVIRNPCYSSSSSSSLKFWKGDVDCRTSGTCCCWERRSLCLRVHINDNTTQDTSQGAKITVTDKCTHLKTVVERIITRSQGLHEQLHLH